MGGCYGWLLWVVAMGGCYGWMLIGACNPMLRPIHTPSGVMDAHDADPMAYDFTKHYKNVTTLAAARLARELSAEATVLLKNDGGLLPLPHGKKIAILGTQLLHCCWTISRVFHSAAPPTHHAVGCAPLGAHAVRMLICA